MTPRSEPTPRLYLVFVALAVVTLIWLVLAMKDVHRFVHSGAVLPLIIIAATAEQIRRRSVLTRRASRVLWAVQLSGFVLGVSLFIAAGLLRR